MDLLDTAWCPVCDRQIPPAVLPVPEPPTPSPAPATARSGTIKASRRKSTSPSQSTSISPPKPLAAPPKKPKTYISQEPTPLYCSPECELADALPSRLSRLALAIPSPNNPSYVSYGRRPPASPVLAASSGSSEGEVGSWGSPISDNSEFFAYLEGKPRRRGSSVTTAPLSPTTASSAESLSSLPGQQPQTSKSSSHPPTRAPSRPPTSRNPSGFGGPGTGVRSRRPSSSSTTSSLPPRALPPPTRPGYAQSPPAQKEYTLTFTRAPSTTASPSSSPPVRNGFTMAQRVRPRDRSVSSTLRSASLLPVVPSSPNQSQDVLTPTPRATNPLDSHVHPKRPQPQRPVSHQPTSPSTQSQSHYTHLPPSQTSKPLQYGQEKEEKQWWSWERLPHFVPTYEAMKPPQQLGEEGERERKRLFYFKQ